MFPSNSGWYEDQRARESREADLRANQDRALGESLELAREAASISPPRTTRSVPIGTLEGWVRELHIIADTLSDTDHPEALAVQSLADEVEAHLPG